MKHEKKVLRVFSKENKGGKNKQSKHNAGTKVMPLYQIRCWMKRKLQPNQTQSVLKWMCIAKTGGISPAQLLSIIIPSIIPFDQRAQIFYKKINKSTHGPVVNVHLPSSIA